MNWICFFWQEHNSATYMSMSFQQVLQFLTKYLCACIDEFIQRFFEMELQISL